MKKILKWGAIVFVGLIVIGVIAGAGKSGTTTTSSPATNNAGSQNDNTQPTSSKPKEWTTVLEASGNANKKTDTFTIQGGGKARITYDFEGGSFIVGSMYVVKEGHSVDDEGGIPEVTVTKAGSDSSFLVKQPGNYYLDVKAANTNWTIKVEEER